MSLQEYRAAPEQASLIFNAEGKVITYTGGYVIDRRVGNTKGWGALFGILTAIGQPLPGSVSFYIKLAFASSLSIAFSKPFTDIVANFHHSCACWTAGMAGRRTSRKCMSCTMCPTSCEL